jgi:hypothetical protein
MENLIACIRERLELKTSRIQVYIFVSRSAFAVNVFVSKPGHFSYVHILPLSVAFLPLYIVLLFSSFHQMLLKV